MSDTTTPPTAPSPPPVSDPKTRANDLRARILKGEQIKDEEYHDIIKALIAQRVADIEALMAPKEKKAKKSTSKPVDLSDFLGGEE